MTKCSNCGAESQATAGAPCSCGGIFILLGEDGEPRIAGLPGGLRFRTYIGDGVYAGLDESGQNMLTTENGVRVINIVYLEPDMFATLSRWVERLSAR